MDEKRKDELLAELMADYKNPEDLIGPNGILKQMTAALVQRAMEAELTDHLGYEKNELSDSGNSKGNMGTDLKTTLVDQ